MSMISSPEEEEIIIKWLLAETIAYQNQKHLWFKSDWLTNTGVHKTLFNIFEQFEIPVTRSWYLYGGYIHSDILLGDKLAHYRYDYTKYNRLSGLRRRARKLLPIGTINETRLSLTKYIDKIFSMSVDSYLLGYFYEDAPEKIRPIYKAKHELGGYNRLLDRFKSLNIKERENIQRNISKSYEMISKFHLAAFGLYKDEELERLTLQFSNLLEASLRKLELLIIEKKVLSKTKLQTLAKGREIFDGYVWKPYACQISYDTITGLRAKNEKSVMRRRKQETIEVAPKKFEEFSLELQKADLKLVMDDIRRLHKLESTDEEFEKSLYSVIDVYTRSKEKK